MMVQSTRKNQIAEAAVNLFGAYGYGHTPTSLIAKEADVSESLIFKHFVNKEGLLIYVLKRGYSRIMLDNKVLPNIQDSLRLIHHMLDMPAQLVDGQPDFWRMQARNYDLEITKNAHHHFIQPIVNKVINAFVNLGYSQPKLEAEFLMMTIESLWRAQALDPSFDSKKIAKIIKEKYIDRTSH